MKIFQIYYDEATKQQLDPVFIPLSNAGSERPDWFEYWPIRQALQTDQFEKDEYIGFFSPRFKEKTGLSGDQVLSRVSSSTYDVISFSPVFHESVLFPNSFHQAERKHPGCIRLVQDYLDATGVDIKLNFLVQDQTRTIFSNYFVAKYKFWKTWEKLADQLFEISEDPHSELGRRLRASTRHRGTVAYQMKIFIMERLISLALELENTNADVAIDHASASRYSSMSAFNNLLIMDALKGQYLKTGNKSFLGLYMNARKELLATATAAPRR